MPLIFDTVERDILAVKVSKYLISMIGSGQLKAGERLPPERELAASLKVGRPALREALRALQVMNLLEVRHGDGTYVKPLDPETLTRPYSLLMSAGITTIENLFEARRMIEADIAALSALRIKPEQLAELQQVVSEEERVVNDSRAFLEADFKIHSIITAGADNPVLAGVIASVSGLLRKVRELTIGLEGVKEQALSDHKKIVEALGRRDSEQSRALMSEHVERVHQALIAASAQDGAPRELMQWEGVQWEEI